MRHAVDCSNYSGQISADQFADLRDNHDLGAVFIQAIDPPAGYPPGVTAQQVRAALDAGGIAIHPYVFWWNGVGTDFLKHQLDLLDPFAGQLHRTWVDVEDISGGSASASLVARLGSPLSMPARPQAAVDRLRRQARAFPAAAKGLSRATVTADTRVQDLAAWLDVADTYPCKLGRSGIYGAAWQWVPYMGNTWQFSKDGRVIWPATYNGLETLSDWDWFGGWSGDAAVHQYAGTSGLGSVTNVDLDVVADAELADSPVQPTVDWGWQNKKNLVVELAGELQTVADQLAAEANRRMGPRRQPILDLTQGVRDRARRIVG